MKRFTRILGFDVFLLVIWFGYTAYSIHSYASEFSEKKSDVAIVLGASTTQGKPSPVFAERLNHAFSLFEKDSVRYILVTGGKTESAEVAESYFGKKYLISKGISSELILTEETSQNTLANVFNAKEVMRTNTLKTALIVSDPLHMKRAMAFAHAAEIEALPSPTQTSRFVSFYSKSKFLCTESIFYMKSFLFGEYLPDGF